MENKCDRCRKKCSESELMSNSWDAGFYCDDCIEDVLFEESEETGESIDFFRFGNND